jgi:hypothetical protein
MISNLLLLNLGLQPPRIYRGLRPKLQRHASSPNVRIEDRDRFQLPAWQLQKAGQKADV